MTPAAADPATERLAFAHFEERDAPGLAALLADPEIARNVTTNGSTLERCLASARGRIAWHNAAWAERGYGVWALRERDAEGKPGEAVVGWCGFAAPDIEGEEDPEILYGLARERWGQGLGHEAARGAVAWLFARTSHGGVSAMISARLNPASVKLVSKLGMTKRGSMSFSGFLPDRALAREVLDYEVWRLGEGATLDPAALVFQAPYKAGQLASLGIAEPEAVELELLEAARKRPDFAAGSQDALAARICTAFRIGLAEPFMDWFHLERANWRG
ncbi:MAG: GNAT family N-acetyltransferase [Kiloniellales bacterium]